MPSARARTNSIEIALDDFLIKNVAAKGKRVSTRVVRRVSASTGKGIVPPKKNLPLPGLSEPEKPETEGNNDSNN